MKKIIIIVFACTMAYTMQAQQSVDFNLPSRTPSENTVQSDNVTGSAMVGWGTSLDNWVAVDFYDDAITLKPKDQTILKLFASKLRSSKEDVRKVHVRCFVFKSYFIDNYGYSESYCQKIGKDRASYIADYLINTCGLNIDVTWNIEIE